LTGAEQLRARELVGLDDFAGVLESCNRMRLPKRGRLWKTVHY
jgi:hypothetical protein